MQYTEAFTYTVSGEAPKWQESGKHGWTGGCLALEAGAARGTGPGRSPGDPKESGHTCLLDTKKSFVRV